MAVQWSTAVRNALLDQWETTIGISAKIKLFSGALPANCAAADPSGPLVEFDLASDWAAPASGGSKAFNNLPVIAVASGAGNAACYRMYASDGVTCHEQGTVTATGGGGDLTIDNVSIAIGQAVEITGWTKTAPGA